MIGFSYISIVILLLESVRKVAFTKRMKDSGIEYPNKSLASEGEVFYLLLKFIVIYGGFYTTLEYYRAFYKLKMNTDMLYFISTLDMRVEESSSVITLGANEKSLIVRHPRGHFVPVNKEMAGIFVGFMKGLCGEGKVENSVEDVD